MSTQETLTSGALLGRLLDFPYNVIRANIAGLTHEDSLVQPKRAGNCLNWIFGHVLASRMRLLRMLGETPLWQDDDIARYDRGSEPILEGAGAMPFEKMKSDFDATQDRLRPAIAGLTSERLAEPMPRDQNPLNVDTLGEMIGAFLFHEGYHAGQTGILRRVIGKDGAIR